MAEAARHDAWRAGDSYDAFMGRWSRKVAPHFLDWLGAASGRDWLEIGCGTGALSAAIVARCAPKSLLAVDPSDAFVATARNSVGDGRATFQVGDAQALGATSASMDVIVSGLVLNFVPDRDKALAEMRRVGRPGATIGCYVWDYPGGGMAMLDVFWNAAATLDASARDLDESHRFPFCTAERLTELARKAGVGSVGSTAIEVPTRFRDFDDFWRPFTLGAGPAPGYCASLDPVARERLKQTLHDTLPRQGDGSITLTARAWAIKGIVT